MPTIDTDGVGTAVIANGSGPGVGCVVPGPDIGVVAVAIGGSGQPKDKAQLAVCQLTGGDGDVNRKATVSTLVDLWVLGRYVRPAGEVNLAPTNFFSVVKGNDEAVRLAQPLVAGQPAGNVEGVAVLTNRINRGS